MNTFEKELRKEADKIRLKARERLELRDRIMSFMEYHPAVSRRTSSARLGLIPSGSIFSYIRPWKFGAAGGAFVVLFAVGISTAAEYTTPGDILYPVKVRVNEEVFSQLSLSQYERIEWETRRVERRIAEARLLAKEGRLTDEVGTQITDAVKTHAENARRGIAELRENDADDAAVAQVVMESALDVQTAVLATEETSRAEDDDTIKKLATAVKDTKDTLAAEHGVPTLTSYDRFLGSIEEATTRAHELFISIDGSITEAERTDMQRRLDDINGQITAANEAQTNASSTDEGVATLRRALGDTQKLIAYMTDIDVRHLVELETLVPKRLTTEERIQNVTKGRETLLLAHALVTERLASSTEPAVALKIETGLKEIADAAAAIEIALAGNEIEAAERILREAEAMSSDLTIFTENFGQEKLPSQPAPEEVPTDIGSTTIPESGSSTPESVDAPNAL